MNTLLRQGTRFAVSSARLSAAQSHPFLNRSANALHTRWTSSAALMGAPNDNPRDRSAPAGQRKQTRVSGLAIALGTGAASAAACNALLSIRNGATLAEFSTTASSTASESSGQAYSGPKIDITLYQYEVCPFCNKVRAYLDYHNIPYRVVEVDPLRKTEMKQFADGYRKVPVAFVDGKQVNGSAAIIDHVNMAVRGEAAQLAQTERQWVDWVDNHLIHLISPNIYRTAGEALQTFEYIADNAKFSAWERASIRYSGAAVMYMVGKKLKKKYNIDDERAAMKAAVKEWIDAVGEGGGKFLAGDSGPGIADLSVYGVLKAIQTFDTFADVREGNEAFCEWYDRTQAAVGDASVTERA